MNASPRRWRLAVLTAGLLLLATPGLNWPADARVAAHAQLVASAPGAGSSVTSSPDELRLVFSEPLETQYTSLDLTDADGTRVLSQAGEIDPDDPYALVVASPGLDDGVYEVSWRTLSAADGHTGEGSFSFAVGETAALSSDAAVPMTHSETDSGRAAGRWVTYLGLLLALGVAVFHRVVIRTAHMPRTLARLLSAGLAISALATAVLAIAAAAEAGDIGSYLLGSRNGSLQVARALVSGGGAVALLLVAPRFAAAVAAATGLLGIALLVGAGHAAAQPSPVPMLGQLVHVVGAAVWMGGIASLLVLLVRPRLLTGSEARPAMRTFVPRFSALALVSIGLVALTGVYAAWVQTGALLSVETEYGRMLVLKSAFAVGALALGGLNFLDGGRMRGWLDGMRSRLALEVALIGAVLLFTAVLAITPPGDGTSGVAIEPVPDAFGEVMPGMSLEIAPGRPGVNRIVAYTSEGLATGLPSLELVLDRVDAGTTTRIPLAMPPMEGMDHSDPVHMSGTAGTDPAGAVQWVADAVVLPPGSAWDGSLRAISRAGVELTRQRFSFSLDEAGIGEGRVESLLDPASGVGLVLLVGGALAVGLGLGGLTLPRCEPAASRLALGWGGSVAALLGVAIAASRLV